MSQGEAALAAIGFVLLWALAAWNVAAHRRRRLNEAAARRALGLDGERTREGRRRRGGPR